MSCRFVQDALRVAHGDLGAQDHGDPAVHQLDGVLVSLLFPELILLVEHSCEADVDGSLFSQMCVWRVCAYLHVGCSRRPPHFQALRPQAPSGILRPSL